MSARTPLTPLEDDSALAESRRNALLRLVDWRFLLRGPELPGAIDLAPRWDSEALRHVAGRAGPGEADVAMIGFPSTSALRSALDALSPGGEVLCRWRAPRLAGPRRARRALLRAGFHDPRVYWAGPSAARAPQFWLPLGERAAVGHLLATRPARSRSDVWLRLAWRLAAWTGLLAPIYVLARAPGTAVDGGEPGPGDSLLLLTGGHRSINKVVGLSFAGTTGKLDAAVKFARVAEAEPGLDREARVLARLGAESGEAGVFPRLRSHSRRAGMVAIEEDPIQGDPLLDRLTTASFPGMARRVNDLLVELAAGGAGMPPPEWRRRLVDEPLDAFERNFGVAAPATVEAARAALRSLGELPGVCEHRDCSPWNIVLAPRDRPVLLDWESAEPDGLPGLDLVYFLANCGFVVEGALDSGRTREAYARLLDPGTSLGAVVAGESERYRRALGIGARDFGLLRLLCWVVHSRSDRKHLELEVAGPPSLEALRGAPFLGLVEVELARPGG